MSNRIGEWELIDHFATGGVAEIYRARHLQTGEIVVIKRIRPDLDFDPEKHAGFIRELQLALLCTHKNLIRGIAKGTEQGGTLASSSTWTGPTWSTSSPAPGPPS